jgi:hypothetical protein
VLSMGADPTPVTCPPSDVKDMIVPWSEVSDRDLVVWDGEFRTVERINPMDSGNAALVLDGEEHNGTIPCGTYVAVRRYVTGTDQ